MTKEKLKEYRDLKLEVDSIKKQIKDLETDLYSTNASQIGKVSGGGFRRGVTYQEVKVDEKDELLKYYRKKLKSRNKKMLAIEKAIGNAALTTRERTLLRLYYLQGKTWEKVAEEMGISWATVHRIHPSALQKLNTK